jgi:hypothetical protein
VNQQAPQSFEDPLYVIMPQWQPSTFFIINDWVACNGGTLPTGGEACLLAKDDQRNWRCVWWRGVYSGLTVTSLGVVMLSGLPISDPHHADQLWNNAGVLSISAG